VSARWASLGVITVFLETTSATLSLEVGDHAEMVASPSPVHRLVEDPCTGSDVEGGATFGTADHDVVDPPAHVPGHLTVSDSLVLSGEGMAGLVGMQGLPCVAVADA
jgi:hypothetical protein